MKLDKNYKVRVNPKQSRKIQELVFGLGGKWNGGTDWVINEIIPFLYVTSGLVMTCDSKAQEYFGYTSSENTEIQADDLILLLTDLLKSAENPLQNIELTPEFEAAEPTFKVGDKVYYGSEYRILTIAEFDENGWIRPEGWIRLDRLVGFINDKKCCHATQENYEMLCKLYPHIKFETPPKELTGSDLARAMLDKGWHLVPCVVSDVSDSDALNNDNCCLVDEWWVGSFDSCFNSGDYSYKYAVPFDPRTGEPLTESILND